MTAVFSVEGKMKEVGDAKGFLEGLAACKTLKTLRYVALHCVDHLLIPYEGFRLVLTKQSRRVSLPS